MSSMRTNKRSPIKWSVIAQAEVAILRSDGSLHWYTIRGAGIALPNEEQAVELIISSGEYSHLLTLPCPITGSIEHQLAVSCFRSER